MQLIPHPSEDFKPCQRIKETPAEKATIIGFENLGKIYLLVCLSSGKTTRIKTPLWGFVCLSTPVKPASYVTDSVHKTIDAAGRFGKSVFLFDSLEELLACRGEMRGVPPCGGRT